MNEVLTVRCKIKEMGKINYKFCLLYKNKYYDLKTLNTYDVFNGENGILLSEILNENLLSERSKKILNEHKNDLFNLIKRNIYLDNSEIDLNNGLNCESISFVLYNLGEIALDKNAEIYIENMNNTYLGMKIGNDIYDIKTKKKVKTVADDLTFGDVGVSSFIPISENLLSEEAYTFLLSESISMLEIKDKPKIFIFGKLDSISMN